jgi:hypothetical protein
MTTPPEKPDSTTNMLLAPISILAWIVLVPILLCAVCCLGNLVIGGVGMMFDGSSR